MTNFNKTCRLCLRKHSHLTDMYTQDVEHVDIYSKLKYVIPELDLQFVNIHNLICDKCCSSIQTAYEFKNSLIAIEDILKTCVNLHKLNDESEKITDFIEKHQDIDESLIDFLKSGICKFEELDTEINDDDSFSDICSKDESICDPLADLPNDFPKIEEVDVIENIKKEPNDCENENNILSRIKTCNFCGSNFEAQNDTKCRNCSNCVARVNDFPTYFQCKHCKELLRSENELKNHEKQHETKPSATGNSVTHICSVCNKTFKLTSKYISHMKRHTGEKLFKCTECDKGFYQSFELTRHMRIHSGEKPYKCTECDKGFTQSYDLTQHMRVHTGEKPYKCTMCGKGFTHSSNLKEHMMSHTGEKPYKCTQCDKRFISSSNVKEHMKSHTGEKPFKCKYCEKSFSQSNYLTCHVRTHTGEKPFKCNYCEKSFSQNNNLTSHIRIHTGEKLYRCTHCGKSFTQSSTLNKHIKLHLKGRL